MVSIFYNPSMVPFLRFHVGCACFGIHITTVLCNQQTTAQSHRMTWNYPYVPTVDVNCTWQAAGWCFRMAHLQKTLWLAHCCYCKPVVYFCRVMWSWETTPFHLTNRWLRRPRASHSAAKCWPWTSRKSRLKAPRLRCVSRILYIRNAPREPFLACRWRQPRSLWLIR